MNRGSIETDMITGSTGATVCSYVQSYNSLIFDHLHQQIRDTIMMYRVVI